MSNSISLVNFLAEHGLPANLQCDGSIKRFNLYGRNNDGWFVGHQTAHGTIAFAGSWKTGEKWNLLNANEEPGAGDLLRQEFERLSAEETKQKALLQQNTATKTIKLVNTLSPPKNNLYLAKKGFAGEALQPENCWQDGADLLIGMYNRDRGTLPAGVQRITPDGEKRFQKDVQLFGSHHTLRGTEGSNVIFCEGFATGLSIWLAFDRSTHVIVCFTAGNLLAVADQLAPHIHPEKKFFAADNDRFTIVKGVNINPGLQAAEHAAKKVGGKLLVPHFPNTSDDLKLSDWNDYMRTYGREKLRLELIHQIIHGPEYMTDNDNHPIIAQAMEIFGVKPPPVTPTRQESIELNHVEPVVTSVPEKLTELGLKEEIKLLPKLARKESQRFCFQPLSELFLEPEVENSWLVEGLLLKGGTSLLAAKPKAGKTTLSRQLAVAVATGKSFLGREAQQGKVLYIAAEEKKSEVRRHFKDMGIIEEAASEILIHVNIVPTKCMDALYQLILEYKAELVIIDTLLKVIHVNDGNAYAEMSAVPANSSCKAGVI